MITLTCQLSQMLGHNQATVVPSRPLTATRVGGGSWFNATPYGTTTPALRSLTRLM